MNFTKATIIKLSGNCDRVYMTTDIPTPFPKTLETGFLKVQFDTPENAGEKFVVDNFGIVPDVVDCNQ